jgi:hypothetical protein
MSGRIGAAKDTGIATIELYSQAVCVFAHRHRCLLVPGQHGLVILLKHSAV